MLGPRTAVAVAKLIRDGLVLSAHDVSDGGLVAAAAEMLIGGSTASRPIGAELTVGGIAELFGESPSRYLLEIPATSLDAVRRSLGDIPSATIGRLNDSGTLRFCGEQVLVDDLARAWLGTLDW